MTVKTKLLYSWPHFTEIRADFLNSFTGTIVAKIVKRTSFKIPPHIKRDVVKY